MSNTHTSHKEDYKLFDGHLEQRTLMAKTSLTNLSYFFE